MLTLRQALQFPCFERARVVAGEPGLDQVVRRVHVVDIPEAQYAWGKGCLLLTAGYGLKDSPERQAALIPTLVKQGLVGAVFSTGWYFEAAPDVIRTAAEAHGFPLIEVPPDVEFISITEALYAEIVSQQFVVKERAAEIHRRLTRLALEGGDLSGVAETLAGILERSVLIESPTFEVLASAQHGPVDEARLRSIEAGRTSPERAQRLLKRGIYGAMQERMRPIRLGTMPDLGMTMERVVAPIIAGREIYGYIWIVAGDHPIVDLDELAIDHAATVAALVLLKEMAVREAQQSMRGDLLTELLRPDVEMNSSVLERAHPLGYQTDHPHQALFVIGESTAGGTTAHLAGRLDNWLRGEGESGLVVVREHGIVVIVESRSNPAGQQLAERLMAGVNAAAYTLVIGVGQVHPNDKSLRRSYDEAVEAAAIGRRLGSGPKVVCFWDLGLLDWLYRLPPDVLRNNPYLGRIQTLAEHDAKANGDLVNTLEAYLACGGALAEAAAAINVHRNTLLYRLGRIEEIAGMDLKDIGQRLNLHVALKGYRLLSPRSGKRSNGADAG